MKRLRKAIASLAIAGMALTCIPLNVLAEDSFSTRLGGYTAAQTAVQIAEQTGWTGTAILSSSSSYGMVDALTAGPLATFLQAPILLTDAGDKLNTDTKDELVKLNVLTVYVTSGTGVISQSVLDELQSMGITVVPLGGVDRFATSANIAQTMIDLGASVSKAAVAYGWKNQDALSISSIASAQREPILLTEKNSIPASVQQFLADNPGIEAADVIGGTGVVSDAVQDQLPAAARYFGKTAYDTNLAVLKEFDSVLKYDHVFIANGETAIDALAGAPLAAKFNAGIVLTNGTENEGTAYVSSKLSADSVVTALGGTAVVPEVIRTTIADAAPNDSETPATGGGYIGGGSGSTLSTITCSVAGTYGPASGSETVQNVQITAPDVILRNYNVTGNLEIAASVGDGNVTLNHVTVSGQTIVRGGGQNSIHIANSNLVGTLVVIKQNGRVRIVAEGSTSIPKVSLGSGAILKEDGTAANSGFGEVSVTTYTGTDGIDLDGDFTDVTIEVPNVVLSVPSGQVNNITLGEKAAGSSVSISGGTVSALTVAAGASNTSVTMSAGGIGQLSIKAKANVQVQGGTVSAVTVESTAANTSMSIASGAAVTTMTLNAGTTVTGTGSIGTAVINASGTTIEQTPDTTTVASTVTGGASVGGVTVQPGETVTIKPVVKSIKDAAGADLVSVSDNQILINPSADFRKPILTVNQNSTMTLTVDRSGQTYNLGSWDLTNSASGNDIFSVDYADNLNILETLNALKATGVQSSDIFSAIDCHAILNAAQQMSDTDKDKVYTSMANIFSQASQTSSEYAFYKSLNLPGVYNAADASSKTAISNIITAAIPSGAGVTTSDLLGGSSAAAIATLTTNGKMDEFFAGINFKQLFDVLACSPNKEAMFTAVNFTDIYNAIGTLPDANKRVVYINAAAIYQAALTVDTSNAINYGALLKLVITSPNVVTLKVSNTHGSTLYTVN